MREDYDRRLTDIEARILDIETAQLRKSEFEVEVTCVVFGLKEASGEDLLERCKELVNTDEGQALPDCEVVRGKRSGNRDGRPGIIKMEMKSLNEKKS